MREILFRGKRLDNGEWVEGFYIVKEDPILSGVSYSFIVRQEGENPFASWYKVDPSTVGQYTGLKDKNGKRIFEGDIVRFTWEPYVLSSPGGYFMYPSGTVFEVRHLESGFMLCRAGDSSSEPNANGKVANYDFWNFHRGLEIIGNIHDNQELMDGGKS